MCENKTVDERDLNMAADVFHGMATKDLAKKYAMSRQAIHRIVKGDMCPNVAQEIARIRDEFVRRHTYQVCRAQAVAAETLLEICGDKSAPLIIRLKAAEIISKATGGIHREELDGGALTIAGAILLMEKHDHETGRGRLFGNRPGHAPRLVSDKTSG